MRVQRGGPGVGCGEDFLWLQPARHPVFLFYPATADSGRTAVPFRKWADIASAVICGPEVTIYLSSYFLKGYRYNVLMLTIGQIQDCNQGQVCTVSTTQSSPKPQGMWAKTSVATKMVRKSLVVLNYTRSEPSPNTAHFLTPLRYQLWPSQSASSVNTLYSWLQNDFLSVETIHFSSTMAIIHTISKERRDEIKSIFRYWRIIYGGIIFTYGNHSAMYASRNS